MNVIVNQKQKVLVVLNVLKKVYWKKKDNEKAFKRAEMIVKEGVKGLIIDMREG